jgi:phosphoadenosine phosphosulfate reductase
VETYQITLGGDGTEDAALGERTGPGFAYDEIVPAIERILRAYLRLRHDRAETFLQDLAPAGARALQGRALRKGPGRCRVICLHGRTDLTRSTPGSPATPQGAILGFALSGALGRVALVSSFGAESAVLLHMAAQVDRRAGDLHRHADAVPRDAGLSAGSGRGIWASPTSAGSARPGRAVSARPRRGAAPRRSRCLLRPAQDPGAGAGAGGFDGWISGRKRFQTASPRRLPLFEREPGSARIKINPLADFDAPRCTAYIDRHALPRHPLVARGYPSIGCAPCTGPAAPGEHPRAGRWRGQGKTECGIHIDGQVVRQEGVSGRDRHRPGLRPGLPGRRLDRALAPDADPEALRPHLPGCARSASPFPTFSDGRGFTLAARLRRMGFAGRLRAAGHVIADQYAMARRSGFDEVEIPPAGGPPARRHSGAPAPTGRNAIVP